MTTPTSCATSSPATSPSPARPWPSACSPIGTPPLPKFVRVMPLDYKRVLDVMAAASDDGLDEAATMQRVMEAATDEYESDEGDILLASASASERPGDRTGRRPER